MVIWTKSGRPTRSTLCDLAESPLVLPPRSYLRIALPLSSEAASYSFFAVLSYKVRLIIGAQCGWAITGQSNSLTFIRSVMVSRFYNSVLL